jgi:DNA polymerase IV (DinB-like DNA polymerase)
MHVDLDYFYAQCEEDRNPSIRSKPVVVCVYSGRTEESGVVSTSNYEARKYGVKAGIPIARAKKLLETSAAVFLPMNRPLYEEVSERIMNALRDYADSFEKGGIDEAYLEVTNRTRGDFEKAEELAAELKQQILRQEHVTCSIGIAPNKLIAKIASDHKKPNGLTMVKPEELMTFMAELPVDRIPGVGVKVAEKLGQLNVQTVNQLCTVDASVLIESFGNSLGTFLYHAARGEDDDAVQEREQPTQFSRIVTLKKDTREILEVMPTLEELANSVAQKLAESDMTCKSVSVIAVLGDLSIHSKSRTLESPTSDFGAITKNARDLMEQFLELMPDAVARRVGVRLSGLSKRSGQTDIYKFLGQ